MNPYHMNEADLVLPAPTQDQSIHVFGFHSPDPFAGRPPDDAPPEFSVVVSRDAVDDTVSLGRYIEQQMEVIRQSLGGFRQVVREDTFVDGLESVLVEYTWMSEHGRMYQRQAFVLCPPASALLPNTRVALTVTGTCRESLQSRYQALFLNLLYSLKFRR